MPSFENTEIAFAHKSSKDLKKAKRLFQAFSNSFLVSQGPRFAKLALDLRLPIKGLIKKTVFHQFCGGETIQESLSSAQELYANNVGAILDFSVEGEGSEESYLSTFEELMEVVNTAKAEEEFPFAVFKCSGIGDFSTLEAASQGKKKDSKAYKKFNARFEALCSHAHELEVPILVDAEETWIQDAIDEVTYEAMKRFNTKKAIVYNTIQCYRTGRLAEVKQRIEQAKQEGFVLALKLVRGAYMEKERGRAEEMGYDSPIQANKAATDKEYDDVLRCCFEARKHVAIMAGTHNEASSALLAQWLEEAKIAPNHPHFSFAQLYGMSDHISYNLASAGFNVAKYLPYGPVREVLPYLSRRAKENSSVKGQAGRELTLINREIKRRRKAGKS